MYKSQNFALWLLKVRQKWNFDHFKTDYILSTVFLEILPRIVTVGIIYHYLKDILKTWTHFIFLPHDKYQGILLLFG